ncbi:MAG: hypothetical protein QM820_54515 [Minicystis sp.]
MWSRLAALGAGVSVMMTAAAAAASSGIESPEGGVELIGRGAAWLARADNPLAVFYNPAALAWQPTGVHVGSLLMFSNKCYTRTTVDSTGKEVAVPADQGVPAPLLPGQAQPGDGTVLPSGTVCAKDTLIPNPQLAANFRLTDKVSIGIAVVAPHSTGKTNWGESLDYSKTFNGTTIPLTQPSPQRYMLVKADALILNPTVAVAFAPTDYLSFGVGFIWGIATADFANFSESVSARPMAGDYGDHARNDVRAELKAKDSSSPASSSAACGRRRRTSTSPPGSSGRTRSRAPAISPSSPSTGRRAACATTRPAPIACCPRAVTSPTPRRPARSSSPSRWRRSSASATT